MDARRRNRRISVKEPARLLVDEEIDGDDLDKLVTLEELQDDDGYCNIVVSDDEKVGGYQSTLGHSLQRQALDSPPPKRSRRVDRSILNVDAA